MDIKKLPNKSGVDIFCFEEKEITSFAAFFLAAFFLGAAFFTAFLAAFFLVAIVLRI